MDIVFIIDQSENAEPDCANPFVKMNLSDDLLFNVIEASFDYAGARAQVDFAIDAIDVIPQDALDSGNVRIAAGNLTL